MSTKWLKGILRPSLYLSLAVLGTANANTVGSYWEQYDAASQLVVQKQYQNALNLLLPLSKTQENFNVYMLIGDAYAAQEHPDLALVYYGKAYGLAQNKAPLSYQISVLFALARSELALKHGREAKQYYLKLSTLELRPEDRKLVEDNLKKSDALAVIQEDKEQIVKAENLIKQGQGEQAYKIIQPLLNKPSALVYLIAGNANVLMNQLNEGLKYYKQSYQFASQEQNPTLQKISLFAIARTQLSLKQLEEAKKTYELIKQMASKTQDLSHSSTNQESKELVIQGLKKADKIKQEQINNQQLEKVQRLIDKGEGYKAWKQLQPIFAQDKSALTTLLAASSHALMGKYQAAKEYYQTAYHKAQHEKSETLERISLAGLARTFIALNDLNAALHTYEKLLTLKSTEDRLKVKQEIKKIHRLLFLAKINHYNDSGQGWKSYQLLLPLLNKYHNPKDYMLAANSLASINKYPEAIKYYQSAYHYALVNKNVEEQKDALIGMATMQMAVAQYVRASKTYRLLLNYKLNPHEYELVKAGLVNSYAYRGWIYKAFNEIPWDLTYSTPDMVVSAIQTALWIQRGDIANSLYSKYLPILKTIKPNSYLARDMQNIDWLLLLTTAKYQLKPEAYYFTDTEDFIIQKDRLRARYYWSQNSQSFIAPGYLKYSQYGSTIEGSSVVLAQNWNPNRFFTLNAGIEPTMLTGWNPFLYNVTASYTPNDLFSLIATTDKEILEGFTAIQNHITFDTYSVGALLQPFPYVSLYGALYKLDIVDDNDRVGFNFTGRINIIPSKGVYGGYKSRWYNGDEQSPYYFNPAVYDQRLLFLGISQPIGNTWRYFAEGAYGEQLIKPNPATPSGTGPSWYYLAGTRGPITPYLYFDIKYGRYHQASTFINSEDYDYQDVLASLTLSFN